MALSERGKSIAEQHKREMRRLKQARIEAARELEETLDATVVGVWGHLSTSGAREYPVYKKNREDSYFVVLGRKEGFESQDAPEYVRRQARRLLLGPRESIGDYETRSINPENTPNKLPIKPIEEFLS